MILYWEPILRTTKSSLNLFDTGNKEVSKEEEGRFKGETRGRL